MKKEVTKFINSLGCSAHYSGKAKQMFVRSHNSQAYRGVAAAANKMFPNVEFKITYNR